MKTLEEAAENYSLNTINAFGDYESFIAGAKWQQEQQDDFAIEFVEWFVNNAVEFYDNTSKGNVYKYISDLKVYTTKELLEMSKKEKGL